MFEKDGVLTKALSFLYILRTWVTIKNDILVKGGIINGKLH